jgi:ectoine hydroxylase-related dioxygenase (phytanoyl-CoA dioxygenase family)
MSTRLSLAEREQFAHQGFLVVRELFHAPEVAELIREAGRVVKRDDLIDTGNLRCRWQSDVFTGECLFDAFDPIIDLSDGIADLAHHADLIGVLSALLDDKPCLFKDKLIFKPPGACGYGLHQDYIAWPDFPRSFLTAAIAIDPCDAANGCIEVFPGAHLQDCLSPEDGLYHELSTDSLRSIEPVPLVLQPGDAAFFGCFMPHRSAGNQSDRWRRQLYLSYNAGRDGGPQREQHYLHFHAWLRERYAEHGKQHVYFQ